MDNKKVETRFNIRLNKHDPEHLRVSDILNKLGRYRKAQYIVKAILYYEDRFEIPDIKIPAKIDEKTIEVVVNRLLRKKEIQISDKPKSNSNLTDSKGESIKKQFDKIDYDDAIETLGEDSINAIANAMAMFKNK